MRTTSTGFFISLFSLTLALIILLAPKLSLVVFFGWAGLSFAFSPKPFARAIPQNPIFIQAITFFIWASISLTWSLEPSYGSKSVFGSFVLIIAALGLTRHIWKIPVFQATNILRLLQCTFWLVIGLSCFELLFDSYLLKTLLTIKNKSTEIDPHIAYKSSAFLVSGVLFSVMGFYTFQKKYFLAGFAFIACLTLSALFHSTTSMMGCIIGLLFFIGSLLLPRVAVWIGMGWVCSLSLFLPLFFSYFPTNDYAVYIKHTFGGLAYSFYHRLFIWDFSTMRWMEKPFLGWGAASSRSIPGSEQEIFPGAKILSLHPHNHLIQSGLELGLIGATLYTVLLLTIVWTIHKHLKSTASRAIAFSTFIATYTFCSAEHSLWHHWWLAAMAIFAGVCVVTCRKIELDQA